MTKENQESQSVTSTNKDEPQKIPVKISFECDKCGELTTDYMCLSGSDILVDCPKCGEKIEICVPTAEELKIKRREVINAQKQKQEQQRKRGDQAARDYFASLNPVDFTNPVKSLGEAMTEVGKIYGDKMNQELDITYKQGGTLLRHIIHQWSKQNKDAKYELSNSLFKVIPKLIRYFLSHADSEYDTGKGLFLFGDIGRGKTLLMIFFSVFTRCLRFRAFTVISTQQILMEVSKAGNLEPLDKYSRGLYCFDDVGFEDTNHKIYGNQVSIMEHIINSRSHKGALTHATSNLTPELIENEYGERIASRMKKLFNFIEIEGDKDFRDV